MEFDVVVGRKLLLVLSCSDHLGIAFVGPQRWLLVGENRLTAKGDRTSPSLGFPYHFENPPLWSSDNVRAQAQGIFRRVRGLTNANGGE